MDEDKAELVPADSRDRIRRELEEALRGGAGPKVLRFMLACLSGVPWVGGAIGGAGGAWSEREQANVNDLFLKWLKLQEDELHEIGVTLAEVLVRIDMTDETVRERVESREYLALVKKAFRDWSAAESETKRRLVRNLLSNAASSRLASDDVVRIFLDWIDLYSEPHFAVIGAVYNRDGISRAGIWSQIHGADVREDSAEADLFKLLMRDLSMGGVIRQHREKDYSGNYLKQSARRPGRGSSTMMSAFDETKPYELTALGVQFVHYTMNEIVPKIGATSE